MDLHKPKPWHGLREFLKEYLIIVVGVLTALAAEQTVEWLHWQHQVHVAKDAITYDLKRLLAQSAHKDAILPCQAERMGALSDALDQAQVSHRLPPLGPVGRPYTPAWSMRSWNGLTTGQTLAHMANRDQILLTAIEGSGDYNKGRALAERDAWAVVQTMFGPGRPTSDSEIAALRQALSRVSTAALDTRFVALGLETIIARSGFLTPKEVDQAFKEGVAEAKKAPFCAPPKVPPAHTRDVILDIMTNPPMRPGDMPLRTEGVGNAIATER
ncbi:hypothetical protein [Phenylobacterium sp.]|jgi:hypothetical protein|uniref:hypothetical protein n=1 Tax=Phenylobacterium sp. TaxID=1871053 RepID=UPI002F3F6850